MKRFDLFVALILVAVVHLSSLFGTYVFDDMTIVKDTRFYDFWSFDWFDSRTMRRPLGRILFALQFEFLGDSAAFAHVINLGIHLLALLGFGLSLDLIVRHRVTDLSSSQRRLVVLSTMMLWGIHPITTTTVTYLVQRSEALAALGMVWSVYCWLRASTTFEDNGSVHVRSAPVWTWWTLSLLFACFAFGSKQTSAGLPLVLMLADRAILRDSWKASVKCWFGPALLMIPIGIGAKLLIPSLLNRNPTTSTIGYFLPGIDAMSYVLAQPLVFLRYLKLTFLPTDLVLDYGWIPSEFSSGSLMLGGVLWLMLLAVVVFLWRRSLLAAWALTWAILVLATTSLVPMQDMIFEHRFYLPLGILVASAMVLLVRRDPDAHWSKLILSVVAFAVVLLSYGTFVRNLDYINEQQLAQVDSERQPSNPRALYRAATLKKDAPTEQRILALRKVVSLCEARDYWYSGTDYAYQRNLADELFLVGRADEAEHYYLRALETHYDKLQRAEVLLPLAVIASMRGQVERANRLFEEGIALDTTITEQIQSSFDVHKQRNPAG